MEDARSLQLGILLCIEQHRKRPATEHLRSLVVSEVERLAQQFGVRVRSVYVEFLDGFMAIQVNRIGERPLVVTDRELQDNEDALFALKIKQGLRGER